MEKSEFSMRSREEHGSLVCVEYVSGCGRLPSLLCTAKYSSTILVIFIAIDEVL